jgi:hypothetical protein
MVYVGRRFEPTHRQFLVKKDAANVCRSFTFGDKVMEGQRQRVTPAERCLSGCSCVKSVSKLLPILEPSKLCFSLAELVSICQRAEDASHPVGTLQKKLSAWFRIPMNC